MKIMFTKKHLAVVMLATGGLASGSAFAAEACNGTLDQTLTISALVGNTCTQQDKIYDNFSWTAGGSVTDPDIRIRTQLDLPSIGLDTHLVTVDTPLSNNTGSPIIYAFSYRVAINTTLAPDAYITTIKAGMDAPGVAATALEKAISGYGTLNAGGVVGTFTQLVTITDTITIPTGQSIISTTNTFEQTVHAVPEPASLALMGLGLAGMGAWRRRKA